MVQKMSIIILWGTLLLSDYVFAQEKITETNDAIKAKYDLAVDYFLKKDYANAHNAFSKIVDEEPNPYKAIVIFDMGMCLQIAGVAEDEKGDKELSKSMFEQATIYYDQAQKILPYFPQLYSNSALVAYYLNQPKDAIQKIFDFGQKLSDELGAFPPDIDNHIYAYRSYAVLLSIAVNNIRADKYADAVVILKDVISQMKKSPPPKEYFQYTAYNSLSQALFDLGDITGTINAIETSIKIAPSQPKLDDIYANLGMLYFKQGNNLNAQDAIEKALVINPSNTIALDYQSRLRSH